MVLDRNPDNYFAQIEQAAFEPSNLVRGIGPSPDKMLLGRLFSYPDTHRHRIGANYLQLPVNQPKCPGPQLQQGRPDALPPRRRSAGVRPEQLRRAGGRPRLRRQVWGVDAGEMVREAYTLRSEDDDFGQPGTLVREVLTDQERANLASNIAGHATNGVSAEMQKRVIDYWTNVDQDLGAAVAKEISDAGGEDFSQTPTTNGAGSGRPVGSGASTGL